MSQKEDDQQPDEQYDELQESAPQIEEIAQSIESKGQYSYKEVSEVSDVTEESIPEGVIHGTARDLEIYDRLKQQTKTQLKILESEANFSEADSKVS